MNDGRMDEWWTDERTLCSMQRDEYTGKDIFDAHKDLILHKNLGVFHFDCVAENLVATLRELDVPEDEVAEAVAVVSPLRQGRLLEPMHAAFFFFVFSFFWPRVPPVEKAARIRFNYAMISAM